MGLERLVLYYRRRWKQCGVEIIYQLKAQFGRSGSIFVQIVTETEPRGLALEVDLVPLPCKLYDTALLRQPSSNLLIRRYYRLYMRIPLSWSNLLFKLRSSGGTALVPVTADEASYFTLAA